jgi:hypothetical protein
MLDRCLDEIDGSELPIAPPPWADVLRSVVKVRADNVAEYVSKHWDGSRYDYPCVAPPWPKAWIEYRDEDGYDVGLWCVSTADDDGWRIDVQVYGRKDGDSAFYFASVKLVVDRLGKMVRAVSATARACRPSESRDLSDACKSERPHLFVSKRPALDGDMDPPDVPLPGLVDRQAIGATVDALRRRELELHRKTLALECAIPYLYARQSTKHFGHFKDKIVHVLAMTFSFCHCKNVVRDESFAPTDRMPKPKRATHPSYRYYTLRITPMKAATPNPSADGAPSDGTLRALHIRRGHFRTYGADRPLFGRVVGTFWVEQHVVGDEKAGVVAKTYAVDAPA